MVYQPIRTLGEFRTRIQFGQTPESIHLDFKETFSTSKPDDMAIDLAAFANTLGGTLLFGVSEARNPSNIRVAKGIVPNLNSDRLKQFLNTVVMDRIRPAVRFQSSLLSLEEGAVLAVNVEPSIEVVGVCLSRQSFSFPYRTEHGNRYMDFAQVEDRMNESKNRHSYLQMIALLGGEGLTKEVVIFPGIEGDSADNFWRVELLRENDQVFVLRRNTSEVHMPLSLIEEAWRMDNMEAGRIAIRLRHRLSVRHDLAIDFADSSAAENARVDRQARSRLARGY